MSDELREGLLIWGAGAIGGLLGAYLVRAGIPVQLVDTAADHVAAVRERGMKVTTSRETFVTQLPICTPAELEGCWKYAVLTVKAQYTDVAAAALAEHVSADGAVLALQNGMPEGILEGYFPRPRIFVTFVNIASDYLAPGELREALVGPIPIGPVDGAGDAAHLAAFVDFLRPLSPGAFATPNIQSHIWAKHCLNTLLSTSSIAMSPLAEVVARPDLEPVWRGLITEALSVALAAGITPRPIGPLDVMAFAPGAPADAGTAYIQAAATMGGPKTHSGSWRDLAVLKRKPESAHLMRPIVERGAKLGVDCPRIAAVVDIVEAIERGERVQSDDHLLTLLHPMPLARAS